MADSLKNKTIKGIVWSTLDNVTQFGVTFVVSIVLARILSPDDYGLIGIVAIFTEVCNTLINGGFTSSLIRKKDVNDDDYNTVFIVNLGMSIVLYAIIFLCSPIIAKAFGNDELVSLTRVASLAMIIGALAIVQRTQLTKRIDFKSQMRITFVGSVISGIIGVVMAFLGYGVWALVAQQLSSRTIKTLLLWCVNKWIPRFSFSKESFHDLFGFGWKMMCSGLLDTVWKELYQVVVGIFYSPATLGQYTRSKHFSKLFSSNLTKVIQRVTYPVLSNIQDDKSHLVTAYRKIIKTTMFITIVCMFFMGAVSEPLLYCLIGPKWHDAAEYLPLICINGALYPLHAINLNMLQVQGRSDIFLGLEIIKKVMFLGPLFIGALVGIMPMLWANLLVGIICYFLNSYYSGRLLGYSSWMQIKDILSSLCMVTIIAIIIFSMKYLPLSYWIILPLQIVLGTFLLVVSCTITRHEEYFELKNILISTFNKLHSSKNAN